MALFRPAFAILLALVGSAAEAGPQAVPRKYQAGFYLDGCKDFLAGRKAGLPPGLGSAPSGFRPILARPPRRRKGRRSAGIGDDVLHPDNGSGLQGPRRFRGDL